ncbi:hypothetical protein ABZ135_37910 [Streptomyces sp. NPDC006339]|uniref:hypothetical protein n=1 Tax=Streptomyces sp. NPDC006339 TaxID=3156755 RepID=UPI0033B4D450
MPWTSENTSLHVGHVEPLQRTPEGFAPFPGGTALPWRALLTETAGPAAAAIRWSCTCGSTGQTAHPIDPAVTVDEAEEPLRQEWTRHVTFSAVQGIRALAELGDVLDQLASRDPRAALFLARRTEERAREAATRAAAAARAAGDSWADIGAAFGITKQSAHSRFRTQ